MLVPELAVAAPAGLPLKQSFSFPPDPRHLQNILTGTGTDTVPPLCIPAIACAITKIPNLDTCCVNTPGGHFLATQFWDTEPVIGANDTWTVHGLWPDHCAGGFDAFCDASRSLSGPEIRQIIADADVNGSHPGLHDFMNQYWGSTFNDASTLWSHEWNKHGTCISTLEVSCYDRDQQKPNPPAVVDSIDVLDYFTHASLLFSTLPTFQFFADHDILPSYERTYTLEQLQYAIYTSSHGHEATIHCHNQNELSEIWYHFDVRGSLRNAMDSWWDGNKMWSSWVSTDPDGQRCRCPAEGIRYLPKADGKHERPPTTSTSTQASTSTSTPTQAPTPAPFIGKGRLMVKVLSTPDGRPLEDALMAASETSPNTDDDLDALTSPIPHPYTGCLIRAGTWYMARSLTSCATFTADDDVRISPPSSMSSSDDDDSYHLFTLSSRFAPCSFVPVPEESAAYFACTPDLGFQSILSNNATLDKQHTEDARRLTVGKNHKSVFSAARVPSKSGRETLWMDFEDDETEQVHDDHKLEHATENERSAEVEIHWLGL